MQTLQTALDYLALLPVATACLMFLGYCWERSAPTVTPTRTEETLNLIEAKFAEADIEQALDRLVDLGLISEIPDAPAEDCDQAHQLAELAAQDEELCQGYAEAIATTTPPDWEPAWSSAALVMEDASVTVQVEQESAIAVQPPVDPNGLNAHELRKECTKLGIKWRNANGKGKHLSRDEMLQAIGGAIA